MADTRPNILFIMADDLSANSISAYGSRLAPVIGTPTIDRLAADGCIATQCYCTNSICTPSRASILTGLYGHSTGVRTLSDPLAESTPTVPRALHEAGYQTALFGKWHLHSRPQGFDDYAVLRGQGEYWNPVMRTEGQGGRWRDTRIGGYVTDLITDLSLEWLDKADRARPFFLLCHHKAPHDNWEYDLKYSDLYEGVHFPEPTSLWSDGGSRSVGSRGYGSSVAELARSRMAQLWYPTGTLDVDGLSEQELQRAGYQRYLRDYARCVRSLDDSLERMLNYLDSRGLRDNTVVFYTSDQGELLGEHGYWDKRWMYDESARMPLVVRYPPEVPARSVCNDLLLNVDFAETFLDFAGVSAGALPAGHGRSFRPCLAGSTPPGWRQALYYRYWMHLAHLNVPAHYGIRTKDFKLIFFYGMPLDASGALSTVTPAGWELYDLRNDPEELENVYGSSGYENVTAELASELDEMKGVVGDDDRQFPDLRRLQMEMPAC